MAAVIGWSVHGKRIEVSTGLGGAKVLVDGQALPEKLKKPMTVDIDGKPFVVSMKSGFMGVVFSLTAPSGEIIPLTPPTTVRKQGGLGKTCTKHSASDSAIECAKCRRQACQACVAVDGTHCTDCISKLTEEAKEGQAALLFFLPALIMVGVGGAIGGALFGAAGAIAVSYAKKEKSTVRKAGAAFGLYAVAFVIYIVIAGALQQAIGR